MIREEARQWIPLLQAYADGAEIEAKSVGENFENMTFDYTYCDGECYSIMKPDEFLIKPQDHSKCVMNFHDHPFIDIAVMCKKQDGKCVLPDNQFCKDFKEIISFPTENTDYNVIAVPKGEK